MIPRTFPSIIEALQTKMVVYVLPSITGLTAWIDYIPVKGVTTESNALANTYATDGYQVVKTIESLTGKQAWLDYIPVFESAAYNKPWSTDAGGYIPAGGLFSVASLFAAGEQGTWYDPSDLTTLFQDSAGTTPVTGFQQPVGLMLDKSKGLVLGANVAPSLASAASGNGATLSGAGLLSFAALATSRIVLSVAVTGFYEIAAQFSAQDAGKVVRLPLWANGFNGVDTGAGSDLTIPASGFVSRSIQATSMTNIGVMNSTAGVAQSLTLTSVTLRDVAGNHAFQTTSASRPVLSARYNLLTKSEQFDDAVWTKIGATVSANAVSSPNGTATADKLIATATTNWHGTYVSGGSLVTGVAHTISIYAQSAEETKLAISDLSTATTGVIFDLTAITATISGTDAGMTLSNAVITSVGGGWYRCSVTMAATATRVPTVYLRQFATSYAGNGTNGIYIWGADLRVSNDALGQPTYQRVNTSTDYDTVGFKPYLAFDGVDDSLVTNSINFTATDKMTVFAGVRKLSDAARGMLIELSATTASNNGAFAMTAPDAASATYAFESDGTILTSAVGTPFTAPLTSVLTGIGNISGDVTTLRVNGTQAATNTGDQGTGNYGNHALFIGRRNQATLPFNGRLYSLIVRGAASTTAQITSTETYVNQKTGAYT